MIAHLDRHLGPESMSRLKSDALVQIASYSKVGDWSVQFTLNGSFPAFPALLTLGLGQVQNVAVLEERGADAFALDIDGAGVGPYELQDFAPPSPTVFKAKQDWWGGPVCIETLVIDYVPEVSTAYDAYSRGEIDVMSFHRAPVLAVEAENDPTGHTVSGLLTGSQFLLPNVAAGGYDGPMSDVRMRRAVQMAIDPEVINQRAWGGVGLPGTALIHEASSVLDPTVGLPFAPDRAAELVDEYREETGWDGVLSLDMTGTPASNVDAAIAIASMLENVGIDVELRAELSSMEVITDVMFDQNFELAGWGWVESEMLLADALRRYQTGPASLNGFSEPEFDLALAEMYASDSVEVYQDALEEMQGVINKYVPIIIYGSETSTTLYRDGIEGILWHDSVTSLFDRAILSED